MTLSAFDLLWEHLLSCVFVYLQVKQPLFSKLTSKCFIFLFLHFFSLLLPLSPPVVGARRHPERPAERPAAALLRAAARLIAQSHGQTEHHQ